MHAHLHHLFARGQRVARAHEPHAARRRSPRRSTPRRCRRRSSSEAAAPRPARLRPPSTRPAALLPPLVLPPRPPTTGSAFFAGALSMSRANGTTAPVPLPVGIASAAQLREPRLAFDNLVDQPLAHVAKPQDLALDRRDVGHLRVLGRGLEHPGQRIPRARAPSTVLGRGAARQRAEHCPHTASHAQHALRPSRRCGSANIVSRGL